MQDITVKSNYTNKMKTNNLDIKRESTAGIACMEAKLSRIIGYGV